MIFKKYKYLRFSKPDNTLRRGDFRRIKEIVKSGWVANGRYVHELENTFKEQFDVKYALACSSCTQGLIIALKAAKIKNKRVALPSFTWPSTLYAVECSGNTPVFCDVDKRTWLMIPEGNYDVIFGVDTFGNQFETDIDKPLIVDAAHGYGLIKLGHRGLVEVVSFSFTKIITAMQGGMILTNSEEIYTEAKELRDLSAKMCEINALFCLNSIYSYSQKKHLTLKAINLYRKHIKIGRREQINPLDWNHSVYSILLDPETKNRVVNLFEKEKIEVKIYYEPLISGLPNTDWIYNRIIALPTYKEVIPQIPRICKIINSAR